MNLPDILTVPGVSLDAYLQRIHLIPLLSGPDERDLAGRIAQGDVQAAQQLAYHNLRLAAHRALRATRLQTGWATRVRSSESEALWSPADGVQAANIGLWSAVWRFRPEAHHNGRFSTYAVWWINQALMRLAEPWRYPIPVPPGEYAALRRLQKAQDQLTTRFGRVPTVPELAAALEWPPSQVESRQAFLAISLLNLDRPISPTTPELTPAQTVSDPTGDLWDQLERTLLEDDMRRALAVLPRRSAAIVMAYYGVGDDHPRTLEEVGRHYGLTRERIRQIIAQALFILRSHPEALAALSGWATSLRVS